MAVIRAHEPLYASCELYDSGMAAFHLIGGHDFILLTNGEMSLVYDRLVSLKEGKIWFHEKLPGTLSG